MLSRYLSNAPQLPQLVLHVLHLLRQRVCGGSLQVQLNFTWQPTITVHHRPLLPPWQYLLFPLPLLPHLLLRLPLLLSMLSPLPLLSLLLLPRTCCVAPQGPTWRQVPNQSSTRAMTMR